MRRIVLALIVALSSLGWGQTSYLGLFLGGKRIGYASSKTSTENVGGSPTKRLDGRTLLDAGLLGAAMKTTIDSTTWFSALDKPTRMVFTIESAGRTQKSVAVFGGKTIEVEIDNNGAKTKKSIDLPTDAPVVDDAVNALQADLLQLGATKLCYVFDPMTATLVKNEVRSAGSAEIEVAGVRITAQVIEVAEPRATMRVYLSAKGDLLKIDGPMGIEMRPINEEEALGATSGTPIDLAVVTAIRPNKPIVNAAAAKAVSLRISGVDLKRLPSDAFQTVTGSGNSWQVTIHPIPLSPATTIQAAAKQKPTWIKGSMNIPANDPAIRAVAKEVVGNSKTVAEAAKRVRKHVFTIMTPNAGIGVLRDAGEVLKTKEGVCRDYAVLTAAILRAGRVPTRVVSGLIYMSDQYYYHAWVEVWDGRHWVGVDSTRPTDHVGADHVKLAEGNVEDAFTFTFLGNAKVEVLNVRRN